MLPESRPWRVIDVIFVSFQLLLVLAALLQGFKLGSDIDNVICVMLTLSSSLLLLQYVWRSNALASHPVSALALIGMCVTSQAAALLIQTADLNSFTRWLRAPLLTFSVLAMLHLVAVLTHWSYRHLTSIQNFTQGVARHVWSPLGILRVPPVHVVWILGWLGLIAFVFGGGATGDAGGKFVAALSFLMWLPFMIPLYQQLSRGGYCDLRKHLPIVLIYSLMIVAIAVVRNFRQIMFIGPIQGLLVYLLYLARSDQPATSRTWLALFGGGTALLLGVWVSTDLVTAMSVVRDKRDKATPVEMIKETAQAYMDKEELQRMWAQRSVDALINPYDETYVSNPLLARFSETKFHDNMFFFSQDLTAGEVKQLWIETGDHMLAILPQNLLDLLGIPLDKSEESYSMGDLHLNLVNGSPLGSFVTGSLWADVYAMTGVFTPFVASALMLLTFMVLDSLTRLDAGYFISPATLCATWPIFLYGLGGESLAAKAAMLLRDIPQRVLLCALAFALIRLVLGLFGPGSTRTSGAPQCAGIERQASVIEASQVREDFAEGAG